jgi:hypothetical protein
MIHRSYRGAMPLWLKIVLGVFVLGIVCVIAIVGMLMNYGKNMMDSGRGATTMQEIAKFEEPLPTGWAYVMNFNLGPMKLVSMANKRNGTVINFIQTSQGSTESPEKMLERAGSHGQMEQGTAGEQTVGGMKMSYMRGVMKTKTSRKVNAQNGLVQTPSGKTVLIQILESREPFDPTLADPILNRVQSFN